MKTVGVRDLKDQLSQYLRLVKDGEIVLVKEHNRIVAEISLPSKGKEIKKEVAEYIKNSVENGKILVAKRGQTIINSIPENKMINNWESIYNDNRSDR